MSPIYPILHVGSEAVCQNRCCQRRKLLPVKQNLVTNLEKIVLEVGQFALGCHFRPTEINLRGADRTSVYACHFRHR